MASGREGAPEAGKDLVIISFNLPGCKNMQLQPHDLHICPYSHGTSCVFQPNADQMLDGFVDNIRHCGDKPNQTAGQQLQGCGREMHTSGSQHRSTIFKIAVTSYINTRFEQFAACSHAGQSPFLASWIPPRSQAFQKMPTFLFALCNSSCILTFAFNGELSEWPKEHDWKSCRRQKRLQGSNP